MNKTSASASGARSIAPLTISVNDALAMLGIGRTRFYELAAAGEIQTIKLGRRRLVIVVTCPQIVAPDQIARVAAIRAGAAPSVTPPRITNSPVLLGGIATCG